MKIKKTLIAAMALMLAVSMVTVCAFAAPGKGNGNGNGAPDNRGNAQGQRDKGKNDKATNDNGKGPQAGFEANIGINLNLDGADAIITGIEEKISALESGETKENLTELLSTYKQAIEKAREAMTDSSNLDKDTLKTLREAVQEAKRALDSALKSAGIDVIAQNSAKRPEPSRQSIRKIDVDAAKEKIEALDDGDIKTNLLSLLESYQSALEAYETAVENNSAESELKSLETALNSSEKALNDALKDADITGGKANRPDNGNNGGKKPSKALDTETIEKLIAALDDGETKTNLNSLLDAYEEALEAEKAALADGSDADDDAVKAAQKAVQEAEKALQDALKKADINPSEYKANAPKEKKQPADNNTQNSGDDAAVPQDKGGFFSGIVNWFSGLFK